LPNRKEYYFRNQLVLDLSNPKVQDFVFGVVDHLLTEYPQIAFFKWDCNSPITNIYSNYLGDKQSHLYVDYVRGLYNVLNRIKAKYPDVPMMLCSGGGGRGDYEALKYFTEFWPSDNTDPLERIYIQYGMSMVFPSKTHCAHVTTWNRNASIKFKVDVASMGKLGFDIKLTDMSQSDLTFCQKAVKNYNRLKTVILDGDMYRLVSPYSGNHASTMFVNTDKTKAVLFAFDMNPRYNEHLLPVVMQGLDENKQYSVKEINRYNEGDHTVGTFSGQYLMTVGINAFSHSHLSSRVYEINTIQ
jgi:alpha-galactosidase